MKSLSAVTKWVSGIVAVLLLALYGSAPLFLQQPVSESSPSEQFSAERAIKHVETLTQTRRVAGSFQMQEATNYLVHMLKSYDLQPEVQESLSPQGRLRNVVARIPGRVPGRALLILTHYDAISVGAGDNASGVAVLLEVARALQAGNQHQNDVILLFEDGEEQGYLGGYAFAKSDRSIKSIRYVIGLDTAAWGPTVLLQTTPGNEDIIRAYADSVQAPSAFGFFADADWNISKDTSEIQPFYEHGLAGLALEDPTAFNGKHSDRDTTENIRPGSLQQMGEQTLSLIQYLGNSDLDRSSTSEHSYFTLWKLGVVHYPSGWNLALAILSAIGLAALLKQEIQRKDYAVPTLLISALLLLVALLGVSAIGFVLGEWFGKLFPNTNPNIESYLVPASLPFLIASMSIVVGVYLMIRWKLVSSLGGSAVARAGLLFWLLFALASSLFLQAGSYIFIIPALGAILTSFLPPQWRYVRIIPAALSMIFIAPNLVLAFLGTGLQTLALIAALTVLNVELWMGICSGPFHPSQECLISWA